MNMTFAQFLEQESKHGSINPLPVAAMGDLLQMKLNSFRAKDRVHIEVLDSCGLITAAIEHQLAPILRQRLTEARQEAAQGRPDVE